MSIRKNKYSIAIVLHNNKIIGYLSNRDIELGLDIELDLLGYTIESI